MSNSERTKLFLSFLVLGFLSLILFYINPHVMKPQRSKILVFFSVYLHLSITILCLSILFFVTSIFDRKECQKKCNIPQRNSVQYDRKPVIHYKQHIKRELPKYIANDTCYSDCTFYLNEDKKYTFDCVRFYNCSFETDVTFGMLTNCDFHNCVFWGKLIIDLEDMQLDEIPSWVFKLKALTHLVFSRNKLIELPIEITELKALIHLDLSKNKVIELPTEIAQLNSLTCLVINDNRIKELPEEISQLKALTRLFMYHNYMKQQDRKQIKKWLPNCQICHW
ncbi:leucine-rich repeat domain-containing protein [Candidatus Uabimicrobium sp. HlEnr_7]|uniref:leucine-rich repeat domain-containing protein n=1 Tax=Candidatus Uabimicrobium helgolandensis TaxID=3095367 RepID=UPI0035566B70